MAANDSPSRIYTLLSYLYPRAFRTRYGEGFVSLLEAERFSPVVLIDLIAGAVDAHLLELSHGGSSLRTNALRLLGRTLLGGLYQMVSFPLAIAYFVCIVTGLAFGTGTAITLIGLPVLALTFALIRQAASFERWLTSTLLDLDLGGEYAPQNSPRFIDVREGRISLSLARLKTLLFSAETWKSFMYLALKFPFSVFAFGVIVMLTVMGGSLLSAPIAYVFVNFEFDLFNGHYVIDDLPSALLGSLAGAFLLLAAVVVINVFSLIWSEIARLLIARPQQPPAMVELPQS